MSRILYLHQHFSTPEGGTATRSYAQARALARAGHEVTVATGRFAGAETGLSGPFRFGRREGMVDGFRVVEWDIPYEGGMGLGARGLAFARYALRALPPALSGHDLVIASSTPLSVAVPALLARRLRGTPFLFEMRDPWPELPRALGLRNRPILAAMEALAGAACREASGVVALSEGMAELARARGAKRVEVIGQGCDLDLFGPHISAWRPEEAASHEALAVYAGAHGTANGLGLLLEAAARLRSAGEARIRIVLVGQGPAKAALMREALRRGLRNVSFVPPLPKRELAGLLAGSQIGLLCLAPVEEFAEWTAPNKLMDFLAAGLPVVSNLPGAAARLLEEGACGVTVQPRDAEALAAALVRLAARPGERITMGRAARELAQRRLDRRFLAARFVAAAETALGAPPRPFEATA
ncbi:glycosyltransferase family 4 protein [Sabulicella rubraurantiaca]|uniref:glycosyltransferase family 4 protein n=1 Tax=Sabulicella rubraurantiaca TaxID=2811429 RepID=UPI001A95FD71|nr:glycosyltransferase family 4 protein [Sabulicella rubraurantiaca]